MTNIFKVLATVDRRVWYVIIFFIIGIPLIRPVGLPIKVGDWTKNFYNHVEALKPGDVVIVNFDIAAFGWDELKAQTVAVCRHVFSKPGVKVIFMTDMAQGYVFIEKMIAMIGEPDNPEKPEFPWYTIEGKKYLVDYINIGYFAGRDVAIAALSQDFRGYVGDTDWYGNKIDKWLDEVGIKNAGDIDVVITFDCAGAQDWWVRHWYLTWKTVILNGQIGVSVPEAVPNYNAGMLKGLLASTRGAAEYEYLTGKPGMALIAMDAFSLIHLFLILVIVLGNIGYFGWERKERRARVFVGR